MKPNQKSFLARAAMTLLVAWLGTAGAWAWEGSGTATSPYKITSATDLNQLATNVNNGTSEYQGVYFKLMNDISYSHTTAWDNASSTESNFTPIGGYYNGSPRYFKGIFDGGNHVISGIRIYRGGTSNEDEYLGLFGLTFLARISNIILDDMRVSGYNSVGGISGYSFWGNIWNCHILSNVCLYAINDSGRSFGGITGHLDNGYMNECSSAVTIGCKNKLTIYDVGGIAGYCCNSFVEDNATTNANICDAVCVGAIMGKFNPNDGQADQDGEMTNNIYHNTTVDGKTSGVGCNEEDISGQAEMGYQIDCGEYATTDAVSFTIPAHGSTAAQTYYLCVADVEVSVFDNVEKGKHAVYTVKTSDGTNVSIRDKSYYKAFIMPASDVTISAVLEDNYYTIGFMPNGGEGEMEDDGKTLRYDEEWTLPLNTFTREGFTFANWNTRSDMNGDKITDGATVSKLTSTNGGLVSLFAQWDPIIYYITFVLNGGTIDDENPLPYDATRNIILSSPSRTGYSFQGWFKNADLSGAAISEINRYTTGDMTLYAKWRMDNYSITYYVMEGNNSSSNPTSYNIETETITLADPTWTGYEFQGWYTNADCTGDPVTEIAKGSTGNLTLWAKWNITTYDITYVVGEGAVNDEGNPSSYNAFTETISLAAPSLTGYVFGGWYTNADCTGDPVTEIEKGSEGSLTLYAKWSPLGYTVSFDANQGSGTAPASLTCTYDVTASLPECTFEREGYTFGGWNTMANGSGVFCQTEAKNLTTTPDDVVTLYAQWYNAQDEVPLTMCLAKGGEVNINLKNFSGTFKYSTDGGQTKTEVSETTTVSLDAGKEIQFYGINACRARITCEAECVVYGNIMSLIDEENYPLCRKLTKEFAFVRIFSGNKNMKLDDTKPLLLPATLLSSNCYQSMFDDCTSLTTAPQLPATVLTDRCYYNMFKDCTGLTRAPELPAKVLADDCYNNMFNGCTGLTEAPELPAKVLADYCYTIMFNGCTALTTAPQLPATVLTYCCYGGMFDGCTSLTRAPQLPATKLAGNCYQSMFKDCTGLTRAPELPATVLAGSCYYNMFNGCTGLTKAPRLPAGATAACCYAQMFSNCSSLNRVEMLAGDESNKCFSNWLDGVAATGTLLKNVALTLPTGDSGIPEGWTIENYVPTYSIRFDANGGTGSMSDLALSYGESKELTANTFSLAHYTFSGWNTQADGSGTTFSDCESVYNLTASDKAVVMLYAQWTALTYTVTFASNNGENETAEMTLYYDHNGSLLPNSFEYYGYYFKGWNTKADGSGTPYADKDVVVNLNDDSGDNVILYAQWEDLMGTPLTFEFLDEGGEVVIDNGSGLYMKYSIDGEKKKKIGGSTGEIRIPVYGGHTLQLYGNGKENESYNLKSGYSTATKITFTNDAYVYGNIMSMVDEEGFANNVNLTNNNVIGFNFDCFFYNNKHLKNHPYKDILLPATTLQHNCYSSLFSDCSGLERAPKLPATSLANACYVTMFYGCSSLTKAPELPATELAEFCYSGMFHYCNNLEEAPLLPALSLTEGCYNSMFAECNKLNHIEMMATNIGAEDCLDNWVNGVATTGTFVKNSDAKWDVTGINGVPNGWTVLTDAISLTDNADNSEVISQNQGRVRKVLLSGRTLYRDGYWNTICLPFDVTDGNTEDEVTFSGTPLAGADVRTLESSSFADGTLTLNFSQDPLTAIEAGKPYIVKWTNYDLEISSLVEWNSFAADVKGGNTYEGKTILLTADIAGVTTPVGTSDNMFEGSFDGAGHTITLALTGSGKFCAPFAYVSGATIANLNVAGTVTLSDTKAYHASGLVGQANGVTIMSCHVSASILFPNGTGTVHSGGIIGHAKSSAFTMTDCLFDGTIGYVSGGSGTMTNVGGLVGWDDASTPNITNCLNNGTFANPNVISKIARVNGRGSITNCYSTINATSDGKNNDDRGEYTTATGDNLVAKLGSNWQVSNGKVVPKTTSLRIIDPAFSNVTITSTTPTAISSTDPDDNNANWVDFVGTYGYQSFSEADNSILFMGAENTLYYPTAGAEIGACRAYFKLADGLTAGDPKKNIKAFVLNFDEESESNSISTIDADAPASDGWFTIDGRRLLEAPEQPGLYIRNGQKVLLK